MLERSLDKLAQGFLTLEGKIVAALLVVSLVVLTLNAFTVTRAFADDAANPTPQAELQVDEQAAD